MLRNVNKGRKLNNKQCFTNIFLGVITKQGKFDELNIKRNGDLTCE